MADPRKMPAKRGWTLSQVARRLGVSGAWFSVEQNRNALYRAGLPRPDPITGKTDKKAVELYMDQRSGIIETSDTGGVDLALQRVKEMAHGHA